MGVSFDIAAVSYGRHLENRNPSKIESIVAGLSTRFLSGVAFHIGAHFLFWYTLLNIELEWGYDKRLHMFLCWSAIPVNCVKTSSLFFLSVYLTSLIYLFCRGCRDEAHAASKIYLSLAQAIDISFAKYETNQLISFPLPQHTSSAEANFAHFDSRYFRHMRTAICVCSIVPPLPHVLLCSTF